MKHDFFTVQPIKGAKVYFLRNVLHDWPNKQAKVILERLHDAMTKNSILLIQESEMLESNVPLRSTYMVLSMMAAFSGLERTRTQFEELLESAGLKLIKKWVPEGTTVFGTLFEAVLGS